MVTAPVAASEPEVQEAVLVLDWAAGYLLVDHLPWEAHWESAAQEVVGDD